MGAVAWIIIGLALGGAFLGTGNLSGVTDRSSRNKGDYAGTRE